jgi:hypothetical protein
MGVWMSGALPSLELIIPAYFYGGIIHFTP